MSKYIVLDTNVIVSALLSHHNDSATVLILNKVLQNELKVVYNKEILNEYRVVLSRNKFRFEPELIEKFYILYNNFWNLY